MRRDPDPSLEWALARIEKCRAQDAKQIERAVAPDKVFLPSRDADS